MLVTNKPIDYQSAPYGHIATIPAGTSVVPATNLPKKGLYWAEPWEGMTEEEQSWQRGYGFLIDSSDVTGVVAEPITPSYSEMDFCPRCQQVHAGGCEENFNRQFEEWNGNSDGSVAVD